MAYGAGMKKLNPCSDQRILGSLTAVRPGLKTLLDAGCGRGERLAAAAAFFPEAKRCGVDLDPENAAEARRRCPDARIEVGDVCELPWDAGSFDAALCECTLSLLDEPARCLSELGRVLRPGGILMLSDLVGGAAAPERGLVSPEGAVRYLASAAWTEAALEDAGFRILRFLDCREEFLETVGQMIFDGSCCVGPDAFAALRREKAGYGLWIAEKDGSEMNAGSGRRIGAVVAAAGLSSRMGAFKPLLPFDGSTVIGRCVANLRGAGAEEIVVVTGHRGEELAEALRGSGVRCVHNPDYARTQMFDSLRLGLRALSPGCDAVLLTPGDVPLVRRETIRALLDERGGFACPVCGGRRGHPVALDAAFLPALLGWSGEGGLRGAVAALGIPVFPVETDDAGMLLDLDTPEDYGKVLTMLTNDRPEQG